MKKRTITGMLVLMLALSFGGCSGSGNRESASGTSAETKTETTAGETTETAQDTTREPDTTDTAAEAEEQTTESASDSGQVSFTSAVIFYPEFQPNEIKEKSVRMEAPIDEDKIMAALQDEGVLDDACELLSYEKDGDTITADFNSECGIVLMRMSPEEADMRAEAVARTFCRNLGAKQFYFYTNGHPLETGDKTYDEPIGVD